MLGLGEAGSEIATDLVAAGALVHGYDPKVAAPAAVRAGSDADAARGASVMLALTSAHEAAETLQLALPGIGAGASYADLNTGSAGLKASLAQVAAAAGVAFCDVALMAPVPGLGLHTPMLVSGPAADYARIVGPSGLAVTVLPGPPGAAATEASSQRLLQRPGRRVTEALRAGQAAAAAMAPGRHRPGTPGFDRPPGRPARAGQYPARAAADRTR